MTRSELVAALSKKHSDLPLEVIGKIVQIILDEITNSLSSLNRVEIREFGAFSLRKKTARMARNPKTNKVTMVDERYTVYFRSGKDFFGLLNNS